MLTQGQSLEPLPSPPEKKRYLLAIPMLLVGLALAAGAMSMTPYRIHQAKSFARSAVPSRFTFHVDHPANYYVYSEDTSGFYPPVTVIVAGPSGQAVKVEPTVGPGYGDSEFGCPCGIGVAKFEASATGDYRITVSTGTARGGRVAIGEDFPEWTKTHGWVAKLAVIIMLGSLVGGIAIIVVPIIQYRRRNKAAHSPIA